MTAINKSAPATHSQSSKARGLLRLTAEKGMYIALPIVFLWFGGMKFTAYEAGAIEGLIANNPFVSWLLSVFSAQGASNLIGTIEIAIAVLLAARFVAPKLAVVGAAGAVLTFVVTFSFFFSTPGVFLEEVGGLGISVVPGQFLLKDLALLVASLWALDDALSASSH